MKKQWRYRGGVWDVLNALVFTTIVVVVAVFGFRLRPVKHSGVDAVARTETQPLMVSRMSESERAGATRWYMLQDPTIPARGDADVGFAVVPSAEPQIVPLAVLPAAVDPPEAVPPLPELPALPELPPLPNIEWSGFPLPEANDPGAVLLLQSDGSRLPCPGLFAEIPSGAAEHSTVIRTIPVGGGLSRLVLTESCGDAALDSFARQELSKIKFNAGNVITVCWPSSVRKK